MIGAAILLGTVNIAQAGVFLGTSYGWTSSDIENAKIDDKVPNLDYEDSIRNENTWGLRVGGDFDFMRVYLSYDKASSERHGTNTQESLLLSADYLYQVEANTRLLQVYLLVLADLKTKVQLTTVILTNLTAKVMVANLV